MTTNLSRSNSNFNLDQEKGWFVGFTTAFQTIKSPGIGNIQPLITWLVNLTTSLQEQEEHIDNLDPLYRLIGRITCTTQIDELFEDLLQDIAQCIKELSTKEHENKPLPLELDETNYDDETCCFFGTSDDDYLDDEPYHLGDPARDADENPWIDVFGEGEEAEAAYWNTD